MTPLMSIYKSMSLSHASRIIFLFILVGANCIVLLNMLIYLKNCHIYYFLRSIFWFVYLSLTVHLLVCTIVCKY